VIGRTDRWTIGIVEVVAAALEEKPDKQDEATKTLHAWKHDRWIEKHGSEQLRARQMAVRIAGCSSFHCKA
jgi:hypothetical protein